MKYRTLWLSDIHLGTKSSRAEELLHFLEETAADRIYLVGDIVDLQKLRSRPLYKARFASALHEKNHDAFRASWFDK